METKLKGKTIFVTDALRNFGTPMTLAFASEGANLFLATLSRRPRADEIKLMSDYIARRKDPTKGYSGVLWILFNSS